MNRRDFLSGAMYTGGMLLLGMGCKSNNETEVVAPHTLNPNGTITEPAKEIPILAKTDVVVVGGGPAGVAAAIASSRAGAETYLVERYNHLGGLWTGGLVLPLLSTHGMAKSGQNIQVIHGIGGEMATRLKDMGMAIHEVNPVIDPEAGKYVLDAMICESGVKTLYHTWGAGAIMDGHTIKGVYIESKSGRQAVLAKVVIDCTGDGDIYHWAGEHYDEVKYMIGLPYRLGNVDKIDTSAEGYKKLSVGSETPIPGIGWCNMEGDKDQCGTDMVNLSRLQQKYRLDIWERLEQIRQTPGYKDVYLLDTASQLGVRASRILDGVYQLTLQDTMTYKTFDDAVGVSGAWTSIMYKGKKIYHGERPYWQIPFRALLPKKTDNLIVAGRCFSFERELLEDARIIGTCLVTGHGAGAGAAIAVKENCLVREVDPQRLHTLLKQQNVWFG